METELYLLRHGQTDWNKQSIFQGQTDIELNETGIAEAKKAADIFTKIKLDHIYSSDLKRAKKTASFVAAQKDLKIKEDSNAREMNFGDWEGLKFDQIKEQYTDELEAWQDDPLHNSPSNGEQMLDFKKRIVDFFNQIIEENKGDKILVVTHGGVIKLYLSVVLGSELADFWQFQIDNCSVTEIKIYDDSIILSKLNFTNALK